MDAVLYALIQYLVFGMEREASKVIKTKTDDALIHILVYKDEYKDHIVEAAAEELRLRKKTNASSPSSAGIVHPAPTPKDAPLALYFAGILFLVCAPLVAFLAFLQAAASTVADDEGIAVRSMWNFICAVLYVTFGIGIFKRARWGYNWGLGTAIVNFIWFGFLFTQDPNVWLLFVVLLQTVIAVCLLSCKDYFGMKPGMVALEMKQSMTITQEYDKKLIELHSLIEQEQKSFFGTGNADRIRELTREFSETVDKAEVFLRVYRERFGVDLIEDLKQLTNSYEGIRAYCRTFIDLNMVSGEFPHNRISK